jgi:hypothetical protein
MHTLCALTSRSDRSVLEIESSVDTVAPFYGVFSFDVVAYIIFYRLLGTCSFLLLLSCDALAADKK